MLQIFIDEKGTSESILVTDISINLYRTATNATKHIDNLPYPDV